MNRILKYTILFFSLSFSINLSAQSTNEKIDSPNFDIEGFDLESHVCHNLLIKKPKKSIDSCYSEAREIIKENPKYIKIFNEINSENKVNKNTIYDGMCRKPMLDYDVFDIFYAKLVGLANKYKKSPKDLMPLYIIIEKDGSVSKVVFFESESLQENMVRDVSNLFYNILKFDAATFYYEPVKFRYY